VSDGARVARLFAEAEALPTPERESFLALLRAEDGALGEDVASLLRASSARGTVLDGSPWQVLGEDPPAEPAPAAPAAIGPYPVIRRLGGGGMGSVFLGRQQGDGFERAVAIKVLDRPAAGEARLGRFRDEARILAGLEHPGIARFYDAGRAADGSLYLVLEYVEGRDLLAHVRDAALGLRQRVELLLQVVDAVAFAHRRLVVHRDLKPGNVMVDAEGRARLLDFGISRILADETDAEATQTEVRALTPAYASPEQLRGERAGPASDVYSLGVMLYELLVGERPFAAKGDPTAVVQAVLAEDPSPPSTAARRQTTTEKQADGGDRRAATAVRQRVDRDLDAICLMALRREPGDRYASAATLADDLRRYLDGGPVAARRGSHRYRLAKLLRRRRAWLGTAAAAVVAIGALLFAVEARWRAERVALPAAAPPPRPFPFAAQNVLSVEEAQRRFGADPADVRAGAELVRALNRASRHREAAVVVARLRQIPGASADPLVDYVDAMVADGLDETQRALILYSRAVDGAVAGGRGELVAAARAARGRVLLGLGRKVEARADLERARADFRTAGDHASLVGVCNNLAVVVLEAGDLAGGERLLEEALAAAQAATGRRPGIILGNLAELHSQRGRPDRAEARWRESLRTRGPATRPGPVGNALASLGDVMRDLGRPAEAGPLYDEGIALLRRSTSDAKALGFALFLRDSFALDRGELTAHQANAAAIEATTRTSGEPINLGYAELLRGRAAAAGEDLGAARTRLREARRLFAETGSDQWAGHATLDLAAAEAASGLPAVASALARDVAQRFRAQHPSALTLRAEVLLAGIAADEGHLEEAERHLAAAGGRPEAQPSVALRIAMAGVRARTVELRGNLDGARADLAAAIRLARDAERKVDELRLRLHLAELELRAGERLAARDLARGVREDAAGRGLDGLAIRAGGIAEAADAILSRRL
jgi:serine/threonine-protein kinase